MAMSAAMKAALETKNPTLVHLVEIQFDDRTVRLTDGGAVMWGGNLFSPEDSELGVINGFSEFSETEGTESPRLEVYFEYRTNAALERLASPLSQGRLFSIWAAAVSRDTGEIIGVPELLFSGMIDDADLRHATNNRLLTVYLATEWELLFDNDEGARWNDDFWTHVYGPNARAFYAVTDVQRKLFWGYKGPSNGSGGGWTNFDGGYIGGKPYDITKQTHVR